MSLIRRKCGQQIEIAGGFCISVLEINSRGAKLGLSDAKSRNTDGILSQQMAEVCRNGACYFWFTKNRSCMLVLWCKKGKVLCLAEARSLTVVDVSADSVTLAVMEQRPANGPSSNKGPQTGSQDVSAAHPQPMVTPMALLGDTWVTQPVAQEPVNALSTNL